MEQQVLSQQEKSRRRALKVLAALASGLGLRKDDQRIRRQLFTVRSYEAGANKTATVETLLRHLQESAVNHLRLTGGFSADDNWGSKATIAHNVTWVMAFMHLEVEAFPAWRDVVEMETWTSAAGERLGMHGNWLIRDHKTGTIIARATSTWVMINLKTRKLCKIPEDVWAEILPTFVDDKQAFHVDESFGRIDKLDRGNAQRIFSDLKAHKNDMDMNQHVSNVKYIRWLLESLPGETMESHEMAKMTLEFRRECQEGDHVESLCSSQACSSQQGWMEYTHLLRMQADGSEILRGKTIWRPLSNARSQKLM